MTRRKNPLLSRMNLTQYFANIRERQIATCVITPTEAFYLHRGEKFSIEKFEKMYSLEIAYVNEKGKSVDPRNAWIR